MSKVFGKNNAPNPKVKRNVFDLSFDNNLSLNFGGLYPVMCKEVIPGDSFEIDTAFGLRFLPLAFPVQTKMRADIHFFYVRNRNLWKDWMDFIGDTQPLSNPPFINPYRTLTSTFLKTGSLADYLGVPTTWSGRRITQTSLILDKPSGLVNQHCTPEVGQTRFLPYYQSLTATHNSKNFTKFDALLDSIEENPTADIDVPSVVTKSCPLPGSTVPYIAGITAGGLAVSSGTYHIRFTITSPSFSISDFPVVFCVPYATAKYRGYIVHGSIVNGVYECDFTFPNAVTGSFYVYFGSTVDFLAPSFTTANPWVGEYVPVGISSGVPLELIGSKPEAENPFTNKVPLSALPFRAYESIYNSFYRDDRNNPNVIDGKVEYNKYLPTTAGGSDNTDYQLRYRNWEQDFLTTSVPTPQQGNAPLVGITTTGVATFADTADGKEYNVQLTASDGDHVDGVTYTENLPNSVARSLVDVVSSGISINDFRNVNAFQRWLETNIRKGLKYRDQIGSHFGVDISYQELDMPEFIGGVSQIVNVQQIDQTSSSVEGSPLGSYAGQAYAVGSANHKIRHYADEHGFIMAILSVSPVPIYSQLLPKFFTKTDVLDYFFPEFGHIGLQPVTYKEVCPIEAVNSSVDVGNVFGYQRAWYDYLASVDECHGLMRTDFRDFLISRFYGAPPRLTPDFLLVRPEQTNNIFMDTDVTDKILGRIIFKIKAKRPIPRYGIPRLE
ncbi:major capsid protein [Sigmofec virus UA08Rod_4626]|uniref:Major capsid protein n=1 Tax=Sigmofec virus UA08Rod_4626 TaxID=2929405 RepID=A0A976R823_9VIRU|nr:major capsid protein [Sigmofec virus UA08Rod_4626]